jgi:hypothetical protein
MWHPRRLTALLASMACYRDSFTFFILWRGALQCVSWVPTEEPTNLLQGRNELFIPCLKWMQLVLFETMIPIYTAPTPQKISVLIFTAVTISDLRYTLNLRSLLVSTHFRIRNYILSPYRSIHEFVFDRQILRNLFEDSTSKPGIDKNTLSSACFFSNVGYYTQWMWGIS